MINTNGVRIAREAGFAERLAAFMPRFEVYLQFDSLRREALMELRGVSKVRLQALEALERNNISTTLVVTLKKGVNDDEIADIVRFALNWRCVRGVTFQPIQAAGRNDSFDPDRHRIVLTEVRRRIAEADAFALEDPAALQPGPDLHRLRPAGRPRRGARHRAPAAPDAVVPENIAYENTFRVVISQFLERYNFDLGTVKRSCVHFVQPDGRIIPFDLQHLLSPRRGRRGRRHDPAGPDIRRRPDGAGLGGPLRRPSADPLAAPPPNPDTFN
jgi:hypothetical protein